MNRKVQLLLAGVGVILAAGMANAVPSGPKTATRAANISGVGGPFTGTGINGACEPTGYDSMCFVGPCDCYEIPTAKVTGSIAGKASADVFITADPGIQTTDSATTSGQCTPFFGVAHVTNAATSLTEDINLTGALCKHFTPNGNEYINGGFGIADGASNNATGWGTLTGAVKNSKSNNPTVMLHLKGPITQ